MLMLFQQKSSIALIDDLTIIQNNTGIATIGDILNIVTGDNEADAVLFMTEIYKTP